MDKEIPTLEEEFEAAKREIAMWREEFIDCINDPEIALYELNSCERNFISQKILYETSPIKDIGEFIALELKCYRETQEKNT